MRGNVPRFFAPHELEEFRRWLAGTPSRYLVVEREQEVVACGGYAVEGERAGLVWGMVARGLHRQGIGSLLLRARLDAIAREPGVRAVVLDTSQLSRPFYERHGFAVVAETPDGYAPGLHRIDMRLELG